MPTRTFDVFDTLIARRCIRPEGVLREVQRRSGIPGLAAARQQADRELYREGNCFTLRELYTRVARNLGLHHESIERLCQLECEVELEEVIPIQRNLDALQPTDVLVSDCYHSAAFIRTLLAKAGLRREHPLIVTNKGKATGIIWQDLAAATEVEGHTGDNSHSDVASPARHGIRARQDSLRWTPSASRPNNNSKASFSVSAPRPTTADDQGASPPR